MPLKCGRKFEAGCLLTLLMIPGLLGQEGKTVAITERLGSKVTLHTGVTGLQNDSVIVWTFGTSSPPPTIAKSVNGRIETNISERFRERLQLDPQTGSLSITNISTSDAGIYQLHIIKDHILKKEFDLNIYNPVNRPHITSLQASSRSSVRPSARGSCWVLCSVENGRDVTLSWYRGTERLNQTSSPDLSTSLSLSLEVWEDSPAYSCVATNPVSKEAAEGNIKQLCAELSRSQSRGSLMVCCCCWTLTQLLLSNNLLQMHRHRMQTIRDQSNNAVCSVSSPTSFIAALPLFLHSYLFIQLVAQKRTNAICPFSICTHSLLGHSDRVTDRGRASKHAEFGVDKVQTTKPLRYTKYIKHKGPSSTPRIYVIPAVLIPTAVILTGSIYFIYKSKKSRKIEESENPRDAGSDQVTYAVIDTGRTNTQLLGESITEAERRTVYAALSTSAYQPEAAEQHNKVP